MKKTLAAAALGLALCGCNTNTTSCVARGTRVLTPTGWVPIEDLSVGDEVFAIDESRGARVATKVVAMKSAMREVGCVELAGVRLSMTSDHPVYCPRDEVYAPAGDWFLGRRTCLAMLADDGLREVVVEWARTFVEVTEVFDITVEHDLHNFIAEGILVHNKERVVTCEIDGVTYTEYEACPCPDGTTGEACVGGADVCGCTDADMQNNSTDTGSDTGNPVDVGPNADIGNGADAAVDAGVDMSMPRHRGNCMTSADCFDPSWACITIPADANGYHTCQPPEAAEPGCGLIQPPDNCCLHTDCNQTDPSGTCIVGPLFYCGGVAPMIANICVYDECASDTDCAADQICLPPRVLAEPVSRCVSAQCKADADCSNGNDGQCSALFDPCNGRLSGFYCTYESSECRADADCAGNGQYCAPGAGDGDTTCQTIMLPP